MNESLRSETEKLVWSWTRHDAPVLRDYLVSGVEDPRLNLQSVLSRHFLVRIAAGEGFRELMAAEYRFSAAMNWLLALGDAAREPSAAEALLYALRKGSDNAEGLEIPPFILDLFPRLPADTDGLAVPNYIEQFLSEAQGEAGPALNTFNTLWNVALASFERPVPPAVLEPACGSANDYRFLRAFGLARLLDYTGFDLCESNVRNARALFPDARFEVGNVFEVGFGPRSFDVCFVHDLFEHLSIEGLQAAVAEICRVARVGICAGFFNMDETAEHEVRPVEQYHWNKLSMGRTKRLFAEHGFAGEVMHIGTFLKHQVGCEQAHNANAYTFLLFRRGDSPVRLSGTASGISTGAGRSG
jgi:SAM-dependent methyltransferase